MQTPSKIVAAKGQKHVGSVTSAERRALLTLIAAANAAGNRVPPLIVFSRVNFKDFMLIGAPKETIGEANSNGWSNEQIFLVWLKNFVKNTNESLINRILLILNHESHLAYQNIKFLHTLVTA